MLFYSHFFCCLITADYFFFLAATFFFFAGAFFFAAICLSPKDNGLLKLSGHFTQQHLTIVYYLRGFKTSKNAIYCTNILFEVLSSTMPESSDSMPAPSPNRVLTSAFCAISFLVIRHPEASNQPKGVRDITPPPAVVSRQCRKAPWRCPSSYEKKITLFGAKERIFSQAVSSQCAHFSYCVEIDF